MQHWHTLLPLDGSQVAWQSNGVTPEHSEDQGLHSGALLVLKATRNSLTFSPQLMRSIKITETKTSINL